MLKKNSENERICQSNKITIKCYQQTRPGRRNNLKDGSYDQDNNIYLDKCKQHLQNQLV